MAEKDFKTYKEQDDELFIINDTKLNVLPMDATLFSDNAVYGSSFLRSNAVFSYRSKHARESVIITLPISISVEDETNDIGQVYSKKEGLKVLTQLSNYPFCFIKSSRIQSYVAPTGGVTTAGFMVFGVEKITLVHDMATPDVLFAEYHLLFSNFAPLIKDFNFRTYAGDVVDFPSSSDMFVEAFSSLAENDKEVETFLKRLNTNTISSKTSSGVYADNGVPYGSTLLLAPHMYSVEDAEYGGIEGQNLSAFDETDIKTIQISASKGDMNSSVAMLTDVAHKETRRDTLNTDTVNIVWSAISDLSLLGMSALQTVRITKYNKIGRHFVSAHKHPILQYMGKSPSRVEMTFLTNTENTYTDNKTSVVEAYTQLFNILDYNAVTFPAANAYNYLKLKSIAGVAMGINNLVPNQKYITASSNRQGVDTVNITFVETNVDEFLKIGKVDLGRERSAAMNSTRDYAIRTFLESYNPTYEDVYSEKNASKNIAIVSSMALALKAMAVEFGKGYSQTQFIDQSRWDTLASTLKRDYEDRNSLLGTVSAPARFVNSIFLSGNMMEEVGFLKKAFLERLSYRKLIEKGDFESLSSISLQLQVKKDSSTWENIAVIAGNKNNYVKNGSVDTQLSKIFASIQQLADAGDTTAILSLNNTSASSDSFNDATISSYTGTNYPDIALGNVQDSSLIDPMFFLKEVLHMDRGDLKMASDLVGKGFDEVVDKQLRTLEQMSELNIKQPETIREAVLQPEGTVSEMAYVAESESSYYQFGASSNGASASVSASQTTFRAPSSSDMYRDWVQGPYSATQLKAVSAIKEVVLGHSLLQTSEKADWVYFLTTVAGIESMLGERLSSGTGAEGLFQIIRSTASSVGYQHSQVSGSNFKNATDAAIKIFLNEKKRLSSRGYTNWVDLFAYYNLGSGGGSGALDTYYKGVALTSSARNGIVTQRLSGVTQNMNGKAMATIYYNSISQKFGHLGKYIGKGSTNISEKSVGVKNEEFKAVSLTREDINKDYVKATATFDKYQYGSYFNAKVSGKTVRILLNGVSLPIAPHERTIKIKGELVTYTEKGQKYGQAAKDFLNSNLKSGFYVRKGSSNEYASPVYNTNYKDVSEIMLKQGLAIPDGTGTYKDMIDINFTGQKDRVSPAVFSANLKRYREDVTAGRRKLSTIMEPGTKAFYANGKEYVESEQLKPTNILYRPTSTTNTFLPFVGGTGVVTSEYGKYRTRAKNGVSREGYHFGIDCVPTGGDKSIIAAAKGIVADSGPSGSAGLRVRIWHDTIGFSTQYFHLSSISVKKGQRVSAGQVIGVMGGTGEGGRQQYAPHGHYQVGFGNSGAGALINPFKTTLLSNIPDYDGSGGPVGLKAHAEKFLNPDFYKNYKGEDLRPTMKVYKGDNAYFPETASGSGSTTNDSTEVAIKPSLAVGTSREIADEYSVYNKDLILSKHLDNMIYPYTLGLNTCFPVIRAYVTVGSDNEDLLLRNSIRLGYYFELDGINNVSVACNNDDNPVDLLTMTLANPSFAMTDDYSVTGKYLTTNMQGIYGPEEIQWVADRIKLKPGNKLHIRAGYGNDPNKLKTIFNGIITDMTHDKSILLRVVCEGFGRELLASQLEPASSKPAGGEWHNSSTGVIFSKALLQDGIVHFGTTTNTLQFAYSLLDPMSNVNDADDRTDPESKRLITRWSGDLFSGNGGFGFHFSKGNLRQRLFTNIYAAEIDYLQPQFSSNLWNYLSGLLSFTEKAGYYYIFEGQTPWQACKEMEFRHPGTLVKPMFYDDRMTMFFGLKEQMYIARDLDTEYMASVVKENETDTVSADYLKQRNKRMELVTNMHIATSSTNIITNGLTLSSDFHTGVNVVYFEDNEEREENSQEDFEEFKMRVDDNLNFWEYRYKTISMPGTHGKYSSFMYGTTALRKEAETMYKGKIVLIGNPSIKAGDFLFIDDEILKMQGIVKVRECVHHYNENGFVTEIVPGLYVESSNFFYTSLFLRLGLSAQVATALSSVTVQSTLFGDKNFNAYMSVFHSSKSLNEKTYIDQVNNGILYNTGFGADIALGVGMNALLGYTTYRTAVSMGLTSVRIQQAATLGAKGIQSVGAGLRFGGQVVSTLYGMGKTSIGAQPGAISRVVSSLLTGARTAKASSTGRLIFKVLRVARLFLLPRIAALALNPFTIVAAAIGTVAFAYIDGLIQEATLTRQPLMFFPVNYVGRPFTAGLSGYKYNSWWESKKENLNRTLENSQKGLTEISMTNPDTIATTVLGWLNGKNTEAVANSIETVATEQALKK